MPYKLDHLRPKKDPPHLCKGFKYTGQPCPRYIPAEHEFCCIHTPPRAVRPKKKLDVGAPKFKTYFKHTIPKIQKSPLKAVQRPKIRGVDQRIISAACEMVTDTDFITLSFPGWEELPHSKEEKRIKRIFLYCFKHYGRMSNVELMPLFNYASTLPVRYSLNQFRLSLKQGNLAYNPYNREALKDVKEAIINLGGMAKIPMREQLMNYLGLYQKLAVIKRAKIEKKKQRMFIETKYGIVCIITVNGKKKVDFRKCKFINWQNEVKFLHDDELTKELVGY